MSWALFDKYFFKKTKIVFLISLLFKYIKANEVVPNVDSSSSNQQAPVYQQAASSSLTNFNWLPGGGSGPTQYVSTYLTVFY